MSFLTHYDVVRYACSCGELKPLYRLYFCRHCLKLRCSFCVSHEVDAYFCNTCSDNYPEAEAWMKGNGCSNCYNCPNCHTRLTVRVTSNVKNKDETDASGSSKQPDVKKKFYFVLCPSCQWSNRDTGIPDSNTAVGGWPERINLCGERWNDVIEYYKIVASIERIRCEQAEKKNKQTIMSSHVSGLTRAAAMKKAGFASHKFGLGSLNINLKPPKIDRPEAQSDVNDLPSDIFTKKPVLTEVADLEQKLGQLETPSLVEVSALMPYRKHLSVKTSQRCRSCEHNVSKPEYNPASIKFKIQLSAHYHVPDVRIMKCEPLLAGKTSQVTLKLTNPMQYQSVLRLGQFADVEEAAEADTDDREQQQMQPSSLVTKNRCVEIEPRPLVFSQNSVIELPSGALVLPQRDEAAEYDDTGDSQGCNDDPHVVWWKSNKLAVKLNVTPDENLTPGDFVYTGFIVNYVYTNTLMQKKEQQKTELSVKVVVKLGQISS